MIAMSLDTEVLSKWHFGRNEDFLSGAGIDGEIAFIADKGKQAREEPDMDLSGVQRTVPVAASATPAPAENGAEKRDLVQAVKAVNGSEMFGPENELRFQSDPNTQRMVVRLVNKKTNEVVSQIPPEYVLNLAADLKRT